MKALFINHTNHPSGSWSAAQRSAAQAYGDIQDVPFPDIPPQASTADVMTLAAQAAQHIAALRPDAVLCQGEFTYTYCLVQELQQKHICVVSACSERSTTTAVDDEGHTTRHSIFSFVQFREYPALPAHTQSGIGRRSPKE